MKVWIQHADYSDEEFDLDLASTLAKWESVDWLAESAEEERLLRNGEECCPPGLGIVHPTERVLHICPSSSGSLVHYHFPKKIMGMFSRQESMTLEHVGPDQVESLIHAFFNQDWAAIRNKY